MKREKRGTKNKSKATRRKLNVTDEIDNNGTVKFYNIIDEINEDTLRNSNASGVIPAAKVAMSFENSQKPATLQNASVTSSNPLQIEYSNPHQHTAKKIDEKTKNDTGINVLEQKQLGIITNHTQLEKDTDLSKIVVNELKKGKEVIGDKSGPVMSNITFTPENDTLTAMAFIAGNLLNKLWSMEKDSDEVSMEIEMLKNEKLQDLLDLFKEPLTMRQEAFLRNALDTLSKAIDKNNSDNITLCDSIADARKFLEDSKNRTWEKSDIDLPKSIFEKNDNKDKRKDKPNKQTNKRTQTNPTAKAVEKLNNVLGLMKKYESVHKRLHSLNQDSPNKKTYLRSTGVDEGRVDEDENSLNTFGNILDKVTKLLLPNKVGKKMSSKIRALNTLSKDSKIKEKMKEFKIDATNSTITAKDKTILDYITKIKNNPSSIIEEISSGEVPTPYIEGDILRNLSEFFKIKSLIELMKLVEEKTKSPLRNQKQSSTTGISDISHELLTTTTEVAIMKLQASIRKDIKDYSLSTSTTTETPKFDSAKDKLKAHLKTIIDDLAELQREKGSNYKDGASKIADALPCLYNILKSENELKTSVEKDKPTNTLQTISNTFEAIKNEFNTTVDFRRSMNNDEIISGRRAPKSILVWDRVLSNMVESESKATRRNANINVPLSYEEIQKKISELDISDPEAIGLLEKASTTRPADQLKAYKSVLIETKKHFEVLKDIMAAVNSMNTLSQKEDIITYVLNASVLIDTDRKLMQGLDKANEVKKTVADKPKEIFFEPAIKKKEALRMDTNNLDTNVKLTRNEILKQLIKNRVTMYIKMKINDPHSEKDSNLILAKNILSSLDKGNFNLAKQLYKIFVTTKEQQNSVNVDIDNNHNFLGSKLPDAHEKDEAATQHRSILDKEPLIQFDEPNIFTKQLQIARQNQMLRNLLSSKSLRVI